MQNAEYGPGSYEQLLRKAQAARGQVLPTVAQQPRTPPQQQSPPLQRTQEPSAPVSSSSSAPQQFKTARDMAAANQAKPFTPEMYEHLRVAISALTTRLNREKPLSRLELQELEEAVSHISHDALGYVPTSEEEERAERHRKLAAAQRPAVITSVNPGPQILSQADVPVVQPPAVAEAISTRRARRPAPVEDAPKETDVDEMEDGEWTPAKGFGAPAGIRNTYFIKDMGAMTPDEYQAALRQKVINRAQHARKGRNFGTIAANNYLSALGGKQPKEEAPAPAAPGKEEDFDGY